MIISNDIEISISDVAKQICECFGYDGEIVYDQKLDGILRKPSDNSKLKSLLPDFRFTGLKQGLQSSVDWFIENYERARK